MSVDETLLSEDDMSYIFQRSHQFIIDSAVHTLDLLNHHRDRHPSFLQRVLVEWVSWYYNELARE